MVRILCRLSLDRNQVLNDLASADGLWPLIDAGSCHLCAQPRPERYATFDDCYQCSQLRKRYGDVIGNLVPITYTTHEWTLGHGLQAFKDDDQCREDSIWAAGFGAVLSAFLEQQLGRMGRGSYDRIVTVPTTAPVIARSLARAEQEGWWVPPDVVEIATIAPGHRRQRERPPKERGIVDVDKWLIDDAALDGAVDVLVIDDMLTTGGSLFSFAAALGRRGVAFVDAVVLARNVGVSDGEWVLPLLEDRVARGHPWTPKEQKRDVIQPSRR